MPVISYEPPEEAFMRSDGCFASDEALKDVYTRATAKSTAALSATTSRIFRLTLGSMRRKSAKSASDYGSAALRALRCRQYNRRHGRGSGAFDHRRLQRDR